MKSVENAQGVPEYIKSVSDGACALLIECRAENEQELEKKIAAITEGIKGFETELPYKFTKDAKEQATLWKLRKETLQYCGGA